MISLLEGSAFFTPRIAALLPAVQAFMAEKVLPYDLGWTQTPFYQVEPTLERLREEVRHQGWWLPALSPEHGGLGLSLTEYALLAEAIGGSPYGYYLFNGQAPDLGNMELLALAGSPVQQQLFLQPLLAGKVRSAFAMTEPEFAGSDPVRMGTTAQREGDTYRLNGHKWFTTAFDGAAFVIVMAITDPTAAPHARASMFIVPRGTPGLELVRNLSIMGHTGEGWMSHAEIRLTDVTIPASYRIGAEGAGFPLAQTRLGPGRIHHCMRWMGVCERAFDLMCTRATERIVRAGETLAQQQMVQQFIALSRADIDSARLLILHTADLITRVGQRAAAAQVSMIKFYAAGVLQRVLDRAIQVHGGLGLTDDTILAFYYREERAARIYDGPDEVHQAALARQVLKSYRREEKNAD